MLLGEGALATWDDTRYIILAEALGAISQESSNSLDLKRILEAASSGTLGRPGVLLFWAPFVYLQSYLVSAQGTFFHPTSLLVPQVGSLIYSILALLLYSRFLFLVTNRNYLFAASSVVLYGALTNSTYYVRSINPFDASLCCAFAALLLAWRVRAYPSSFITGLMAGVMFITYPGYFWGVVMVAVTLVTSSSLSDKKKSIGLYFSGVAVVPLCVEILTTVAGVSSYSDVLTYLVPTVSRGDARESLIFPIRYLLQVEGILGILLLLFAVLSFTYILPKLLRKPGILAPCEWLFMCGVVGIILHGCSGVLFGTPVFYGRLLHGYLPFLCLAPVIMLRYFESEGAQKRLRGKELCIVLSIACAAVLHIGGDIRVRNQIVYPRDLYYSLLAKEPRWENAVRFSQSERCSPTTKRPSLHALEFPKVEQLNNELHLINFCDFYEISEKFDELPLSNQQRVFGQHFIHFPAYQFEGYSPVERERIAHRRYVVAVTGQGPSASE